MFTCMHVQCLLAFIQYFLHENDLLCKKLLLLTDHTDNEPGDDAAVTSDSSAPLLTASASQQLEPVASYGSLQRGDAHAVAPTQSRRRRVATVAVQRQADADPINQDYPPFATAPFDGTAYALPICGFVAIVTYSILVPITRKYTDGGSTEDALVLACYSARFVMFLASLAIVLYGFYLSTKFQSRHIGYSAAATFFIGPTFFIFIYDVFRLLPQALYLAIDHGSIIDSYVYQNTSCRIDIPSVPTLNVTGNATISSCISDTAVGMATAEIVVHVFQVYTQTSFILHVIQVVPVNNQVLSQTQYQLFRSVLFYLAMFNLYCWVSVSFVSIRGKFDYDCVNRYFFEDDVWSTISHVILPIKAIYRFQSFMTFLLLFLQYM